MTKIATVPTPPKARGLMKRALREIVDPSPTVEEATELWKHFDNCCIYCGQRLERGSRKGHLDHLDSAKPMDRNHVSNRVLACNVCNGDEKREANWQGFLAKKCPNEQERSRRVSLIESWQRKHVPIKRDHAKLKKALDDACANADSAFNKAVEELRQVARDAERDRILREL